jgi:hypothetical protein
MLATPPKNDMGFQDPLGLAGQSLTDSNSQLSPIFENGRRSQAPDDFLLAKHPAPGDLESPPRGPSSHPFPLLDPTSPTFFTESTDPKVLNTYLSSIFGSHFHPKLPYSSNLNFEYFGKKSRNLPHGPGRLIYNDPTTNISKEIYSGLFLCGAIHSKNSKINSSTLGKAEYMGETFFGYKNGFGIEFNPETGKMIYKGTFEFDKFSGEDCELYTEGRL